MKDLQEMKRVKLFLAGLCMMVMPCVSGAQEEDAVKGLHLVGRDQGKNVLLRWAAGDYALWVAALQKGFVLERYAFDTSALYSASAYSDSMPPPVKTLIRIPPFMEMDTSVLASKAEEDPYAALLGEAVFSPGIQFSMGDDGSGNSIDIAVGNQRNKHYRQRKYQRGIIFCPGILLQRSAEAVRKA